eukprot:9495859-Pyramimonas_sp.AAC.1
MIGPRPARAVPKRPACRRTPAFRLVYVQPLWCNRFCARYVVGAVSCRLRGISACSAKPQLTHPPHE